MVYANKTEVTHQVSCYAGKKGHGHRQLIWGQGQLNSRLCREQVLAPVGPPSVSSSFFWALVVPSVRLNGLGSLSLWDSHPPPPGDFKKGFSQAELSHVEPWTQLPLLFGMPLKGFPDVPGGKEPASNAGDIRDAGSIPGAKIPWRRACNPLQYPCLENPHGQRSLVGYSPWRCRVGHWSDLSTPVKGKNPNSWFWAMLHIGSLLAISGRGPSSAWPASPTCRWKVSWSVGRGWSPWASCLHPTPCSTGTCTSWRTKCGAWPTDGVGGGGPGVVMSPRG